MSKRRQKQSEKDQPETNESQPEQPTKERKLSGSDVLMRHLCANPNATIDELKEKLNKADLKLADSTIKSWPPFMTKIFDFQKELGWKPPK